MLLVIDDSQGHLFVYVESLEAINRALERSNGKKLDRGKIGQSFVLAYDESKQTLALCGSNKVGYYIKLLQLIYR